MNKTALYVNDKYQLTMDFYHGQDKFTITDCHKYEGEWKEGKQQGKGACTYPNGMRYEGE